MPTQNDLHVDQLLTNVSVAFLQSASSFVASRVFPDVSVAKQSDLYVSFDRGDFNRDAMRKRADATETAGSGFRTDTDTYFAHVYGLHKDIGDQQRANADSVFQLDQAVTNYLAQQALINKEKIFATNYLKTSTWLLDRTGVASGETGNQFRQWNDPASTPIEDVSEACTSVHLATGFRPNKMVMGREVFDHLKLHPDILDRLGLGAAGVNAAGVASKQAIASLFELDEILIMDAIENTKAEVASSVNPSTETNAFIGGKKALVYYTPSVAGLWTPAAGYTFSWSGLLGQGGMGTRISKFRMDALRADRVEIEQAFDMKLVSKDLGVYFTSVVV